MGRFAEQILGQVRPADTNANKVYGPTNGNTGIVRQVVVSNNTAGALTYSIYVDNDGTTYDATTALAEMVAIAANTSVITNLFLPIASGGNLAVKASAADSITFTVSGAEIIA